MNISLHTDSLWKGKVQAVFIICDLLLELGHGWLITSQCLCGRNYLSKYINVCLANLCSKNNPRIPPGTILGMGSGNERRRYIVTSSLIGWAHTQTDPCSTNVMYYVWSGMVRSWRATHLRTLPWPKILAKQTEEWTIWPPSCREHFQMTENYMFWLKFKLDLRLEFRWCMFLGVQLAVNQC